jgi:hypothetical protein
VNDDPEAAAEFTDEGVWASYSVRVCGTHPLQVFAHPFAAVAAQE